ncbi:SEC-C domain-containing protein [Actinomycetospora callitridis]|uniref:SEC-C domain-containing protein n=1 Tax=Actinomycetospora callitridis TaxID=913944 RepID=UPI002366FC8C|nr:SEC-C domain-containing protein [Actinomycetospora callitridis]MDD7920298.1 SEC-C domain-containing protein [Actinomycetospora callitridis]
MALLLTADDLDGIGADAQAARDPRPFAVELVAAVEGGRLADPDDAGYALSLAAEARELAGDHEEALALSARAATRGEGTVDATWLQAIHAERLLRLGREDEGMAALAALRPLLHRDVDAVGPIVEALTETGRAELAEQWVTAAMLTAMEREDRATDGSEEQLEVAAVVDELVMTRRDVRAGLGRVPDEYDTLADDLGAAPDLVFFPEAAFTRLLAAQPEAAGELGRDWDAHRAIVEGELQAADAEGEVLEVEVATPELLAAMLSDDDAAGDAATAPEPGPRLPWPPGRNDPCWCGSRAKYKKCCLPRGRQRAEDAGAPEPAAPQPAERPEPVEPEATPAPSAAPKSSERVIQRRPGPRSRAR